LLEFHADSEAPIKWALVLSATFDDMDKPTIEALVEHLKKLSGDASLTLKRIDRGSVILTFEGTQGGFERILSLIESEDLEELIGFPVQNIQDIKNTATDHTALAFGQHSRSDTEGQKRLLLIDEDADFLALTKDYLEFQGYQSVTVGSTRDALLLLDNNPLPDMIICEATMSEMDGYAFVEQIRQDPRKSWIPILMLIRTGQSQDRVKGLTTGADVFMVKPLGPEELVAQIESSLKQSTRLIHHQNKGQNSIPAIQVPFDVELTPIELKVVQFVARGMANRQIADELKVSQRTIESHVSNMMGKTGLSRMEIAQWAVENRKV
jgi:DNA-binding NarL/FixJ family response regulator